jgi:serine/threonine protein kinase
MSAFDDSVHKDVADIGEYKLGATLGKGSFGVVKEATKVTTGEKFAIKIIPAEKIDKVKLEQEIKNQQALHHKHVVEIVEILTKHGDTYIVMELVSGEDLFDFIVRNVRIPEKKARRLFQQIIAGVEHCHSNKVAHRDLKPENIFLDHAHNIKIGDFGLSATMEKGKLLTDSCGSPNYAAPELLNKNCEYEGSEVDIWSCGIILFSLLCNHLPFDARNYRDLFNLIRQGQFAIPGHVSIEATDLIKRMLTVDRSKRISLSSIKEHPWFTKDVPTDLFTKCAETQYDEETEVDEPSLSKVSQSLMEFPTAPSLSTACFSAFAKNAEKEKSATSLIHPSWSTMSSYVHLVASY